MASENSSNQIPHRWQLRKNSSKSECYRCPESQQPFSSYEDMMQYVKDAKEAKLLIYSPVFHSNKRKKRGGLPAGKQLLPGRSSDAFAPNQNMGHGSESDSASETESVSSHARPEAVLVLSQESTNQAPTPAKPQSPKGMKKSQKKRES